jgi:fructose-1,6-bisphosphatase/inositol monophosphatase family enzyme
MYGQKWSALQTILSFSQKDAFMRWLENNKTEDRRRKTSADPELGFRFYDFAGNPMMARLGEGIVDVVFDKNGQAPHDVVPGAYIAKKAGGVMKDFDGKMLDDDSRRIFTYTGGNEN